MRPCDCTLLGNCGTVGKKTAIRVIRRKREDEQNTTKKRNNERERKRREKRAYAASRFQWEKEKTSRRGQKIEKGAKKARLL